MRAIKLINTYYCSSHWLVPCLSIKVGNMTMADEKIQNHNKIEMNVEWNGKLRYNQIEIKWSVKEMANISWLKAICYACSVHSVHFTQKSSIELCLFWMMDQLLLFIKKKTKENNKRNHILQVCWWCVGNRYQNFIAAPKAANLMSINKINIFSIPYNNICSKICA